MTRTTWIFAALTIAATAALSACGNSPPAPSSGGPPVQTNTITLTSGGASPRNVEIALGSRVRFVNNDTQPHDMTSDPHPSHTDCPEINQVGVLAPGESRETGNFVEARTCGFHDHRAPGNQALQGKITAK